MPDGKWKLHTVSAAPDRNGKLVLRIKKMSLVMQAFSNAKECKDTTMGLDQMPFGSSIVDRWSVCKSAQVSSMT
jgi:hypothetical protein